MLVFVPDATFTQQLIMYSFFIGTPILLITLIAIVGFKSVKQNNNSKKCMNCGEFLQDDSKLCGICAKDDL